jgi:multiple sugar transport system ATP-binding protein
LPFSIESEIEIVEPMGAVTVAWTRLGSHAFTVRADSELELHSGQKVLIGFDPGRGSVFEAASGERM